MFWGHYVKNTIWPYGRVDWNLVKLGMFWSYDQSSSSSNSNDCSNNVSNLIFPYSFPRSSMAATSTSHFSGGVDDIQIVYTSKVMVVWYCMGLYVTP